MGEVSFELCFGDALVGIQPYKVMSVLFRKLGKEFLLRFKAVELVFLIC